MAELETVVSVVVPARNSAATIGRTLAALADQDLDDAYEVIVVDNGSDDETALIAERSPGPVTVIRQPAARVGVARNRGVAVATAPLVAFTDADCVPDRGWLRAGVAALRQADLVQGVVAADAACPRHPFDRTVEVGGPSGLHETCNLFVSRAAFERAGGFDDWSAAFDEPFGEDAAFGWRARRAGARFAFEPAARVAHAVFPRGPLGYIAERRRFAYFPALVSLVPELRREFLFARLFLTGRSARFDLALAGVGVAAARRSPAALLATFPYSIWLLRRAGVHGPNFGLVAATELAADCVGFVALAAGSVRHRAPVL